MRILRSGEVFGRPGGLLREVWGVWGTILAPIGWVGWRNGSGAGNWRANGASNGSLGGGTCSEAPSVLRARATGRGKERGIFI